MQPTYLQQWNLSIQRQLGTSWLLTVNYLGNHTVHLLSSVQGNYGVNLGSGPCNLNQVVGGIVQSVAQPVCTTAGNLTLRRVTYLQNPLQGQFLLGIATVDDGATASYNALFVSAQKRPARDSAYRRIHLVALHRRHLRHADRRGGCGGRRHPR